MRRHHGGGAASTTTTQEEEEEDCGGSGDVYAVDLAWAVVLHERPKAMASLQRLDLFV